MVQITHAHAAGTGTGAAVATLPASAVLPARSASAPSLTSFSAE
jgi:hypothetical protein